MTSYEQWALFFSIVAVLASAASTIMAIWSQHKLHADSRLQASRLAFIDIWPIISAMQDIDIQKPAPFQVVKNVNALELVAACWEGRMVDIALIRRVFRDRYIEMYEAIKRVPKMEELKNKDGLALLNENPAATKLYDELKKEWANQGALG